MCTVLYHTYSIVLCHYGWQAEIVTACRELGVGPGGFYLPKLANGAEMKLRMMCLGKHWEPNLKAYETTRSFFDNAVPPQVCHTASNMCSVL